MKYKTAPTEWRSRVSAALAAGGCSTSAEWSERHPGVHCWFVFRDDAFNSCVLCGLIQRADGVPMKPCKGIARIVLR